MPYVIIIFPLVAILQEISNIAVEANELKYLYSDHLNLYRFNANCAFEQDSLTFLRSLIKTFVKYKILLQVEELG